MVVNGCSSSVLSHQEMVGNDTPEITCFGLRGMQNIKLNYMQYDGHSRSFEHEPGRQ